VALNPDLNQSDGMHPNKEGTVVISKTLEKSIFNYIN
jgi:acyl-CoA thioesterase-1